MNYDQTIQAIKTACEALNISLAGEGDGRIISAVKETEYLDALKSKLESVGVLVEIPASRYWYDVRINAIPFNLKLTTGGTDNAFNKTALYYTITGNVCPKKNMNFGEWYALVKAADKKKERDRQTEYHYLVVEKETKAILVKSILDIHTYKSNPCNDLQINWNNEFKNKEYVTSDADYKSKVSTLLKTVQTSIRQAVESMRLFAEADIDADIA